MNTTFRGKIDKIVNLSLHNMNGYVKNNIQLLLLLAMLYEDNHITKDKLLGQLQSLRKGELNKKRNTYHCTILNCWRNDKTLLQLFQDSKIKSITVSFPTLIEVIMLYTNAGYNYAINLIINEIIYPLLTMYQYRNGNSFDYYFSTTLSKFPHIEHERHKYECDCCGHNYSDFTNIRAWQEIVKIIDYFHNYKKGNLKKIPRTNIQ